MSCIFLICLILLNGSFEEKLEPKIVGGYPCFIDQYPFLVSLHLSFTLKHKCGASILSQKYILTASHCTVDHLDDPRTLTVAAGVSRIGRAEETVQLRVVLRIHNHPQYDNDRLINDIAIILVERLTFSSTVKAVALPNMGEKDKQMIEICANAIVMGWGDTEPKKPKIMPFTGYKKTVLKCVELPIITSDDCEKNAKQTIPDTYLCTMYAPGGKDACQGDSGGPLVCKGVQIGVVCGGQGCAQPNSPGFFTRVDQYEDFIKGIIGGAPKNHCNYWYILFIYIMISFLN